MNRSREEDRLLAEGQAALLLGEAMMLTLIEMKLVDRDRVLEAVENVIAAKRAMLDVGQAPAVSAAAIALLTELANSLAAALGGPGRPAQPLPPPGREPTSG